MTDLKKMTMSELIARYNELSTTPVTEFKTLAAARAAVQSLENKMTEEANTVVDGMTPTNNTTVTAPAGDAGKYN